MRFLLRDETRERGESEGKAELARRRLLACLLPSSSSLVSSVSQLSTIAVTKCTYSEEVFGGEVGKKYNQRKRGSYLLSSIEM